MSAMSLSLPVFVTRTLASANRPAVTIASLNSSTFQASPSWAAMAPSHAAARRDDDTLRSMGMSLRSAAMRRDGDP